jgi:tetratricopeptide (TPR) repeat protein
MRHAILPATFVLWLVPAPHQAGSLDELGRQRALRHFEAGEASMRAEDWPAAAEEFRAAVRLDPGFVLAHYNLGQAYMALKSYPEAVRAYGACREALQSLAALGSEERAAAEARRDEELKDIRQSISAIESGRIKTVSPANSVLRLEERVRFLEAARSKGAGGSMRVPAELSLALGSAHFRAGQLAEAEREYGEALQADGRHGPAHNNLAVLYWMTGRLDEADRAVKQAERAGFKVSPRFKKDLDKARKESPRGRT